MATKRRTYKVAERLRSVIAMQIQRLSDPRFSLVTVTSVNVTPDLRNAKVYWSVVGGKERAAEVEEALQGAAGVFRRELAQELGIRFVPEIRFYYDDTMDVIEQNEALFKRAKIGE